jgi:vacuolar-type H+-ATPase subunit I/STV1
VATRIISTRLAVDGEAEFKKQMTAVNGELRNLKTEMQLVDAEFKGQANSLDYLTKKDRILRDEMAQQEEKVRALEAALEDATKAYGEADSRTDKYRQQLNQAQATLINMNRAVDENAKLMSEAEKSSKKVAKSVDEYGKSTKDAQSGTVKLGDLIKANLTSEAIVGGVKTLASAMREAASAAIELGKQSVEAAAEINAENSQFEQTFGELGDNAAAAIQRVADSSGILDTRLRPAASQIYAFARASGGDAVESMDLMETALQAAADSAAYYDRSLEDTTDSLMSFLKGNFSNDAALGVSATETTRNAAAMELFGEKYSDLTEVQKQQTLLKMVTDAQELSGAMGQAAREADGWENVQGNLNEALRQTKANIGQELLPAATELSQAFTSVLSGDMDTEQFAETAVNIVAELTTSFADQAPEMVEAGVQLLTSLLDGLMQGDNAEQIADSMAEIIISLVDGGVEMLPYIVEFAIHLISTLAISLVEHIPDLVAKVPDIIFGIVNALLKGLPDIRNVGVALIQGLWEGWKSWYSSLLRNIENTVTNVVDWVKDKLGIHSPSTVFASIGEYMMQGLALGMEDSKGEVLETADDIIDEVKRRFSSLTDVLDTSKDVSDLQYQLWELTGGKDSTEAEKYEKRLETLTSQQQDQADVVEAAQAAYEAVAEQYGENSAESLEYQKTLLKEQIEYQKLLQEIQSVIEAKRMLGDLDSMQISTISSLSNANLAVRNNNVTKTDLQSGLAQAVNAIGTMQQAQSSSPMSVTIQTKDGIEIARAFVPDIRKAMRESPEVANG